MPVRMIEVIAKDGHADTLEATAHQFEALEFHRSHVDENGMQVMRILARPERQQDMIDHLQKCLGSGDDWRIVLLPVDAILPDPEPSEKSSKEETVALREELYVEIARGAKFDLTFVLLVLLSTVVASIGLFNDNVAVIIAAMVIAPLLGPNMALAFGCALGDRELISRAAFANLTGIILAIAGAAVAGFVMPDKYSGPELISRTVIGYDAIALALASGAAGAISITTRVSNVLVGVMVAAACRCHRLYAWYGALYAGRRGWRVAAGQHCLHQSVRPDRLSRQGHQATRLDRTARSQGRDADQHCHLVASAGRPDRRHRLAERLASARSTDTFLGICPERLCFIWTPVPNS